MCGKIFINDNKSNICSEECRTYYKNHLREYLSKESLLKLSEAGKKSANIQREIRRSKNEMLFCKLCEEHFNNVEHNINIFNGWDADVIIHDIKYAVLWNGKWHYEKIASNQSIKQIQNRDNIKINEIIKFGYTPYIIKDMGKYNENFVKEKFQEFLKFIE